MGLGPREIILRAVVPAAILGSVAGCGGSGDPRRAEGSPAGGFPDAVAQAESTFNPSDYGVETWETGEAAERKEEVPAGDSAGVAAPDTIQGFRVQVTITEDIDFAVHLRDSLSGSLPDEWVYIVHHPPYYKVRVGNFSERFAAAGLLESLRRRGFPDAWIVPDRVLRSPAPPAVETPELVPDSTGGGQPEN